MITVGITGGIGSGKSTVCEIWAELGAFVLNADELAKHVMVTDSEVKQQLIDTFGQASYHADGSLNIDHLAIEAFEKDRVKELNAIVHPKLPTATSQKMKAVEAQGYDIFVYEAALLLDNLVPDLFDYIVLVLADKKRRIERVKQRDNSSEQEVVQRIAKQRNFEKSTHLADYVIHNNRTFEELKKKAEIIYTELKNK